MLLTGSSACSPSTSTVAVGGGEHISRTPPCQHWCWSWQWAAKVPGSKEGGPRRTQKVFGQSLLVLRSGLGRQQQSCEHHALSCSAEDSWGMLCLGFPEVIFGPKARGFGPCSYQLCIQ